MLPVLRIKPGTEISPREFDAPVLESGLDGTKWHEYAALLEVKLVDVLHHKSIQMFMKAGLVCRMMDLLSFFLVPGKKEKEAQIFG